MQTAKTKQGKEELPQGKDFPNAGAGTGRLYQPQLCETPCFIRRRSVVPKSPEEVRDVHC